MSDSISDLCPCGSGLRAVRCCRLELQTPPSAMALRCLAPLTEQAIEAHRRGDLLPPSGFAAMCWNRPRAPKVVLEDEVAVNLVEEPACPAGLRSSLRFGEPEVRQDHLQTGAGLGGSAAGAG